MSSGRRPPDETPRSTGRRRRDNLVLIGLRGSGKSSVARLLAERLGFEHVDTDELVERGAGRTIREIFEADGEAGFRVLETRVVESVTRGTRQVISVGGGAILSEQNRRRLRRAGICVWLTAPPEELCDRLRADAGTAARRPPLTELSGLEEMRRLLRARESLYRVTADHVVDTAGRSVARVVEAVVRLLAREPRAQGGK